MDYFTIESIKNIAGEVGSLLFLCEREKPKKQIHTLRLFRGTIILTLIKVIPIESLLGPSCFRNELGLKTGGL